MTERIDGAWNRACPSCGKRVRRDNTTGYCVQHRHLAPQVRDQMRASQIRHAAERPRYRSAAERMRELAGRAWAAAAQAGHDMMPLMKDAGEEDQVETGYVSYCRSCDRFLVVDLYEQATPYGDVVDSPCQPRPSHADRPDEYSIEAAQSVASLERQLPIESFCRIYLNDGPCTREALDRAGW